MTQVPDDRSHLDQVPAAHAFWPKSQLFLPFSLSVHRPSGFSAQGNHVCDFFLAKRRPIWQNPITNPNPTPTPNPISILCWFVSKTPSFVVLLLNFPVPAFVARFGALNSCCRASMPTSFVQFSNALSLGCILQITSCSICKQHTCRFVKN